MCRTCCTESIEMTLIHTIQIITIMSINHIIQMILIMELSPWSTPIYSIQFPYTTLHCQQEPGPRLRRSKGDQELHFSAVASPSSMLHCMASHKSGDASLFKECVMSVMADEEP
jgi:hypothetical protein